MVLGIPTTSNDQSGRMSQARSSISNLHFGWCLTHYTSRWWSLGQFSNSRAPAARHILPRSLSTAHARCQCPSDREDNQKWAPISSTERRPLKETEEQMSQQRLKLIQKRVTNYICQIPKKSVQTRGFSPLFFPVLSSKGATVDRWPCPASQARQIFGGNAYTRSGLGEKVWWHSGQTWFVTIKWVVKWWLISDGWCKWRISGGLVVNELWSMAGKQHWFITK